MATPSIQSSPTPSRWDRVKAAFREANEAEAKKSVGDHLKDQGVAGAYFAKGVGKSALQILEAGIKTSPPVMTYEGLKPAVQEIKKAVTDYDGWKGEKKAEWEAGKQRMSQSWEGIQYVHQHPQEALKQAWELTQDFAADQAITFAKTPLSRKAEVTGMIAGHVTFAVVGGAAAQTTKGAQAVSALERGLILSEGLTDQAMLQGALKAMTPASAAVTSSQSALKLAEVMQVSGVKIIQGLEEISSVGLQSASQVLKSSIKLKYDPTNKTWTSPAELKYSAMKNGENRIQHVLEHLKSNNSKDIHSVFSYKRNELLSLIDEAWLKRGPALESDPLARIVEMGRVIGTQGETKIRIVVNPRTLNIKSAYPVK